jgi:aspartyl-tRNA(Asn)/glutamyl-tRNA(Gln) amidotransferase subunit C
MKITDEKIMALAKLARLSFEGSEREHIRQDLENILGMCEQLQQVDTTGVEPLIYMSESHTVLRRDEVIQTISKEEALKNAPKRDSDFFRAPKVIEQHD